MKKRIFVGLLILSFLAVTMGCAEWNRTGKGAAIGAGAGAAAGGLMPPEVSLATRPAAQ
jgi:hypothetical protein